MQGGSRSLHAQAIIHDPVEECIFVEEKAEKSGGMNVLVV